MSAGGKSKSGEGGIPFWAFLPFIAIVVLVLLYQMSSVNTQPGNQFNVEYFFRLLYECITGACYGSTVGLSAWFAHLWRWITIVGYLLSIVGLFSIVYGLVRLFELREREEKFYSTLILPEGAKEGAHPRWKHIQELIAGTTPSEWREAIIEADIMLDDALTRQGYVGDGVSEKLKAADKDEFKSLQSAWEAHKVRNQIAHQGSSFDLSESLARRTIGHYQTVFDEFGII